MPPKTATIRYTDRGWLQIVRSLHDMNSMRVKAGIVGANARLRHPDRGLAMADVGMLNEYGTEDGHVPERSWMRRPLRSALAHRGLRGAAGTAMRMMLHGTAPSRALAVVGAWAVSTMTQAIAAGIGPDNAKATIEKKGHGLTLRDAYALASAINYKITTWAENIIDDDASTKVAANEPGAEWY